MALSRLLRDEEAAGAEDDSAAAQAPRTVEREPALEAPLRLNDVRIAAVVKALQEAGVSSVVDLGCGEGKLLAALLKEKSLTRIVGVDVSMRALEIATDRLNLDRLPSLIRNKLELLHGALTYRDRRWEGFDAATVIEVIEHLDAGRLKAFERVLFEFSRPRTVVMTTPNAEYNVKFSALTAGSFRHPDHRFEWARMQFEVWANRVAGMHGYQVRFCPVGESDAACGAPTQMAIFEVSQA